MFEFHKDKQIYFKQQTENAEDYVLPFIDSVLPLNTDMKVLEVGCAEAGVLKAFLDRGLTGVGVELVDYRASLAQEFLSKEIAEGRARIISKNIYDDSFAQEFAATFDVIVLKDVIEHIHEQEQVMKRLKEFLKPQGIIFFGFPPWQMPFGGHQQICKNKWLSKLPYYHLLPKLIYKAILKAGGESELTIAELLEVKQTGISIERFERCVRKAGLKITKRTFYLINPIYKYKFGLKARKQMLLIAYIPWLRNYFTTCMYYVVSH
jgi:SAM-dependent methyltransferase